MYVCIDAYIYSYACMVLKCMYVGITLGLDGQSYVCMYVSM